MWYYAKVQLLPEMEKQLRQDILWGEASLPKTMVGIKPVEGQAFYLFGCCRSGVAIADSGELEDLQRYFKVLEFGPAEPLFVGEAASAMLASSPRPMEASNYFG